MKSRKNDKSQSNRENMKLQSGIFKKRLRSMEGAFRKYESIMNKKAKKLPEWERNEMELEISLFGYAADHIKSAIEYLP